MSDNENPALPEIVEERDRFVTKVGNIEIVQTADSITIQERCRSRLNSELVADSSKPLSE